jgi:membrane protein implicated in regulation of membrane protease activity
MFGSMNRLQVGLSDTAQRSSNSAISKAAIRSIAIEVGKEAIVTQAIAPGRKGQVKFQGSWWTARCSQDITLRPGNLVRVIDRQLITLYVEPVFSNAQGH